MENRQTIDTTLGRYLKDIRLERGLSQIEVGERLNISGSIVGYIEKGKRMPTMETLELYSQYFNIQLAELLKQRIQTVIQTVDKLKANTPPHIYNEYHLIRFYEEL